MKQHTALLLFVVSAFLCIVSPALFRDGMFMDGLLYATISRNLAQGTGSFWNPFLTATLYPEFHEHPPLALGLQSIFFRVFGDSLYVERLYSLTTFIIIGYLCAVLWRKTVSREHKEKFWLPLFLLILIPVVSWSAANNMLENTLTIITLSSIILLLSYYNSGKKSVLILSGLMLFLGVLTKGPVGLYPLSVPFWRMLFIKKPSLKNCIIDTLLLLLSVTIPFLLFFYFNTASYLSMQKYFLKQVAGSIQHVSTVKYRFFILIDFIRELSVPLFLTLFCLFYLKRKNLLAKINQQTLKQFYFLFAIILSGVLPVMVSMKQRGFYILTVYPLAAVALGLFIAPALKNIMQTGFFQKLNKISKSLIYLCIAFSIVFSISQFGKTGRDKAVLHDIHLMKDIVPKNSIISISPEIQDRWSLHGYFYRYAFISLDCNSEFKRDFLLTDIASDFADNNVYEEVTNCKFQSLRLFKKKIQ